MADTPWDLITRSQRAAVGLLTETVSTMVDMGRAGVTRPEEVLHQVTALASAAGDLAASTARPLEIFLESQRQLAETMSAFAVLQRQLADVMDTAATNHAAIVQALEMMSAPVITVAQRVRTTPGTEPDEPVQAGKQEKQKPAGAKTRRTTKAPRTPRTED